MIEQGKNAKDAKYAPQPIDFSSLVLGFSSAALYYLGEAPLGDQKVKELNLPLAKQNIDILDLLKEKTKGNLNSEEEKLMTQILADLKMRYIDASKKKA